MDTDLIKNLKVYAQSSQEDKIAYALYLAKCKNEHPSFQEWLKAGKPN